MFGNQKQIRNHRSRFFAEAVADLITNAICELRFRLSLKSELILHGGEKFHRSHKFSFFPERNSTRGERGSRGLILKTWLTHYSRARINSSQSVREWSERRFLINVRRWAIGGGCCEWFRSEAIKVSFTSPSGADFLLGCWARRSVRRQFMRCSGHSPNLRIKYSCSASSLSPHKHYYEPH